MIEQQIGFGGKVQIKYREGGSYRLRLYALRLPQSQKWKHQTTVKPSLSGDKFGVFMGNMNAPYQLGWNNTFSYKGFTFYFLADNGRIGGKVISFTEAFLDFEGLSARSGSCRQAYEANKDNLTYRYKDLSQGAEHTVARNAHARRSVDIYRGILQRHWWGC